MGKELAPCHVCDEDRMIVSKDRGQLGDDLYCGHCAACGLSTKYFSSKDALIYYWNRKSAALRGLPIPPFQPNATP